MPPPDSAVLPPQTACFSIISGRSSFLSGGNGANHARRPAAHDHQVNFVIELNVHSQSFPARQVIREIVCPVGPA